ncbi:MAG: hypothetical protein WDO14_07130 [Bacteroidota bacterium]
MTDQPTILDNDFAAPRINRRKLLPWWIKTFCWIFMVFGAFIPISFIAAIFFDTGFQISIYGLSTFQPLSSIGLLLLLVFFIKGMAGYGLWFEKDWALLIGQADAIIGIVICLCSMLVFPFTERWTEYSSNFRIELVFLILYLAKLVQLKSKWN